VVDIVWTWLQDECHNFIRVLLLHDNLVFACGTNSYAPQCSWRKVKRSVVSVCASVSTVSQRSFAYNGPAVWNSLPATLRDSSESLHTFQQRLKTYLF